MEEELIADIRNKLSPIKTFLQTAYDERLPLYLRKGANKKGLESMQIIEDLLNKESE